MVKWDFFADISLYKSWLYWCFTFNFRFSPFSLKDRAGRDRAGLMIQHPRTAKKHSLFFFCLCYLKSMWLQTAEASDDDEEGKALIRSGGSEKENETFFRKVRQKHHALLSGKSPKIKWSALSSCYSFTLVVCTHFWILHLCKRETKMHYRGLNITDCCRCVLNLFCQQIVVC